MDSNNLMLLVTIAVFFYVLYTCKNTDLKVSNEESEEETKEQFSYLKPTRNTSRQNRLAPVFNNVTKNIKEETLPESEEEENDKGDDEPASMNLNDSTLNGSKLNKAFTFGYSDDYVNLNNDGTKLRTIDMNKKNKQNYNVKDYLPLEVNDEWFDTDFSQAKHDIKDNKLINTDRYVIGVNTVGQSLKNASYDIRTTIPNPKMSVSPWNNSTYEPDNNKKSLC